MSLRESSNGSECDLESEKVIILATPFCKVVTGSVRVKGILGDPGADSRDDTMFVVKVYLQKTFTTNIVSS